MDGQKQILGEHEAAAYLGVSVETLRAWRVRGGGPRFSKLGKRLVRYRLLDLEAFVVDGMRTSTSATGSAA